MHTNTIKTLMVWKRTEARAGPEPWKKRAPELEPCSRKEELRSRSCDIFTTARQPWNNPHCSGAHRRSRV